MRDMCLKVGDRLVGTFYTLHKSSPSRWLQQQPYVWDCLGKLGGIANLTSNVL